MSILRPLCLLSLCSALGCTALDTSDLFNAVSVDIAQSPADSTARFDEVISSATDSLAIALPAGEDLDLTDAILAAYDRGVDVELVIDIDQAEDVGFATLLDAGVPITQADDGLEYFEFNFNDDVGWPSEETIMSSAFVVADNRQFISATTAGTLEDGPRVLISGRGETLIEDLLTEHNQIYGGADAVAVTAYDSPAKSIADDRWNYWVTSGLMVELWFGPQERVTKRIIDSVYGARSSIWVMTDDFANEGLTAALQTKAEHGFDVRVVVGPHFGDSAPAVSRILELETPDISKRQVATGRVPTVVLVDVEAARNGTTYPAKAFVVSHDLYSSSRYFRADEVVTDQLIDGTLWVLNDNDHSSSELNRLVELFQETRDEAGGL